MSETTLVGDCIEGVLLAPDPADDNGRAECNQRIGKDANKVIVETEDILTKDADIAPDTEAQADGNAKEKAENTAGDGGLCAVELLGERLGHERNKDLKNGDRRGQGCKEQQHKEQEAEEAASSEGPEPTSMLKAKALGIMMRPAKKATPKSVKATCIVDLNTSSSSLR